MQRTTQLVAFVLFVISTQTLFRSGVIPPAYAQVHGVSYSFGFSYNDFSATTGLTLVQSASGTANKIRLTPNVVWQKGAIWYSAKQSVQAGFDTQFQFQITNTGSAWQGADGFAFVIQNSGATAIGGKGIGLGYSDSETEPGIVNSLAIEFDTWQNPTDPNDNHISIHTRGMLANSPDHAYSLASANNITNLSDGLVHTGRVQYVSNTLLIFVDDLVHPVLFVNVNLASKLSLESGQAWVGFTAGTGDYSEDHSLLSWSFGPNSFTVSGRVVDGSGNGMASVTLSDGAGHTAASDSNGNYVLNGLVMGTNTVTPIKAGYEFAPATCTLDVPPNATAVDFNGALLTYSIAGRIADSSSKPLLAVSVSDQQNYSTTSTSSGDYLLANLLPGTYIITPIKTGFTFSPSSRSVTVPTSATAQDFVGAAIPVNEFKEYLPLIRKSGNLQ